jgi:hypothetical protein
MIARISNLYKTEDEWCKIPFIPAAGELVLYAPGDNYKYVRVKAGDGKTPLESLPFFTDACVEEKLAAYQQATVADGGHILDYLIKSAK